MALGSRGEISSALGSGDIGALVGTTEDERLEFKLAPYHLDEDTELRRACGVHSGAPKLIELSAGLPPPWGHGTSSHPARGDEFESIDILGSGDPNIDAYEALSLFYEQFDLPPASIPFTENGKIARETIERFGP